MQVAYLTINQPHQNTTYTNQVSKLAIVFQYERTSFGADSNRAST
ncbi:hypothetical protein CAL7102_04385 [Dulcicalothrix desertica PCC 7102]|nr:hypothetical protein CAL7102_04385 [Dulcicalothrix desertica PCC 7102]